MLMVYLLDSESQYKIYKLKNKEFTFDVDVSSFPVGWMVPSTSWKWMQMEERADFLQTKLVQSMVPVTVMLNVLMI